MASLDARSPNLLRRSAVEALATALLLAAVVGSGIMADRLAAGNAALALLCNSLATGACLVALLLAFGPYSGAHINPAVTVAEAFIGGRRWREVPAYVGAQLGGALVGVALANVMFGEPVFSASRHDRSGFPLMLGEFVATFGLLAIVFFAASSRSTTRTAISVGCYIASAYWFTSSTSFANPAVTLARSVTDTFTGIRPGDVPGFLAAQSLSGAVFIAFYLRPARRNGGA